MKIKILISTIGLLFLTNFAFSQTTVTYTESTEIISNPERGLQKYSITDDSYYTVANYTNLSQTTLTG